jgi:NADPH:quinone reductase-like Zn-dependent oxidoreductase
MRAATFRRYGPPSVLGVADVPRPVPKDDEVLVEVHAATVNRTDCGFRTAKPPFMRLVTGLVRPRRTILGTEFAGVVVDKGALATSFEVGDRVFGVNAMRFGTQAEFVCVRESAPIATMPDGLGFEEAAAIGDGFVLARSCLQGGHLDKGQKVLIYGASGSIGSAAVQLAKSMGAEVTAVCDTKAIDVVRSLGADEVVDYTKEDFTVGRGGYDIVFDAVGKTSYRKCRDLLKPRGFYLETDLGERWENPVLGVVTRLRKGKQVRVPFPHYTQQNILALRDLLRQGAYRAVIDRRYPLDEIVTATQYVESEQKIGNVVLVVANGVGEV